MVNVVRAVLATIALILIVEAALFVSQEVDPPYLEQWVDCPAGVVMIWVEADKYPISLAQEEMCRTFPVESGEAD